MKQEDIDLGVCCKKDFIFLCKSCPILGDPMLFTRDAAVVVGLRPHNVYIFGILVRFARG